MNIFYNKPDCVSLARIKIFGLQHDTIQHIYNILYTSLILWIKYHSNYYIRLFQCKKFSQKRNKKYSFLTASPITACIYFLYYFTFSWVSIWTFNKPLGQNGWNWISAMCRSQRKYSVNCSDFCISSYKRYNTSWIIKNVFIVVSYFQNK